MNTPVAPETARPRRPLAQQFREWDTWWSMLLMLFCVTAICGVPFLWASRAYKLPGKVGLTILVTLYTLLLFWIFWVVMVWCYQRISDAIG
ncbi:MAG TPA: hypothetical protein DCQ98_03825 [Planctomycetaceae bacterium]|nr:hypothetical protein [Planctomycetaceae bacterium]HRE99611.1 hypothetical protein [Pirellulaceae bacterium]